MVSDTLTRIDRRDSVLVFCAPDRRPLLGAGLLEDVFRLVLDARTPPTHRALGALAAGIDREALDSALLDHHALAGRRGGRSYRVIARMAGRHAFRREDIEAAFARAVGRMLPHWVAAPEAAVEVWVQVAGPRTLCGVRLSTDALAQRRYKRAHIPGSLKPTVARALALWSEPAADDVVIDPLAGAGTVLRERAEVASARVLVGGDIDAGAVNAARANAGSAAALATWDATRLPLASGSVDAIITNPPYGRQHEAPGGTAKLYRGVLREMGRVLRPRGRCVVLTGEPDAFVAALPRGLFVRARHRLLLRGLSVTAFVLARP